MQLPSTNKIEDRAISALRNIIDDHMTMGHQFNSMDREMSWDGYIWIYKDINGTQDKKNYDDKISVQIKGHIDEKQAYIDKRGITYSVELEDLEVYFRDRGVLYFEIFMSKDGKKREIFYASLFPTKLKFYLEKASRKGNKKTINIPFVKIEKKPDKLYTIVKQFSNESKMQGFGHEQIVQNAIKLKDIDKVRTITASAVGVSNDIEFIKRLGVGDVSFYGIIDGNPFKMPLEWCEGGSYFLYKEIYRGVYVNEKQYFDKYKIQISSEDEIIFIPSNNLYFNFKKEKLSFKPQTDIKTLRNDAEFLFAIMEYSEFQTADTAFPCNDFEISDGFRKKLQFYIDLDNTLSMIEFEYDKPIQKISEENINCLVQLIAVRKGQKNELFTEDVHIFNWKIDDKYVPVVVFKNNRDGENKLFNAIYTTKYQASVSGNNEDFFKVPLFSGIDVHVLSNLYEYNYKYFYDQIDEAVVNENTSEILNQSALKLIQVYDQNKDVEMLEIALYIINKLRTILGENQYYLINELQIKKRQGLFDKTDKSILTKIESDDLQLLCAKNILLGQKLEAKKYYESLPEDTKEFFDDLPIYTLYKELVLVNA
ncbi:MAG: hypothetical protein J1E98_12170 [Lachnospiraceae bacterium]|nr:hypothetical protein [Lachnospiraceae bacterium]